MKERMISRGDLFYYDFGERVGSVQSGERPVLVVQADDYNKNAPTVIVAAVTSVIKKRYLPSHIILGDKFGLKKPSMVLLEQVQTVNKDELSDYIGTIEDEHLLRQINATLKKTFGLWVYKPEKEENVRCLCTKYPQYYYAYEVLYWCGLRIGELLALSLSDIDFEGGIISVTKTYNQLSGREIISTPKTPSSVRKVSMPAFLVDELKEYIGLLYEPKEDQRIFQISKSKINSNFHKLSDQAGLKRITIHGLRHSHVSLLISKKYDIFEVSKRIGHKSVKTTQDIYGHLFDDVQKSIANDLNMIRRGGV